MEPLAIRAGERSGRARGRRAPRRPHRSLPDDGVVVHAHVRSDLRPVVDHDVVPDDDARGENGPFADDGELADADIGRDVGARGDAGGLGDEMSRHGDRRQGRGVASASYPRRPMILLLAALAPTPEGYGTGLEWLPIASFIFPLLLLAVIWYLGSRNTV